MADSREIGPAESPRQRGFQAVFGFGCAWSRWSNAHLDHEQSELLVAVFEGWKTPAA
jgi:hypothetical protein